VTPEPRAAETVDDRFRAAVSAIDAGDVAALQRILAGNPTLACERLESPGAWLLDVIGAAANDFFQKPYLLWFVAEDPVRNGRLPANIRAVARTILDAAERNCAAACASKSRRRSISCAAARR
jgi:hypothetical protein